MPVLTLVAQGPLTSRFTPLTPFSFMQVVQGSSCNMYVRRTYIHTSLPRGELEGLKAEANRIR